MSDNIHFLGGEDITPEEANEALLDAECHILNLNQIKNFLRATASKTGYDVNDFVKTLEFCEDVVSSTLYELAVRFSVDLRERYKEKGNE